MCRGAIVEDCRNQLRRPQARQKSALSMDDVFRREAAWRIRTPIDKAPFRSMLPVFSLRPSLASRTADGGLHPYCDSPSSSPVLPERRLQASIVTPPSRCPLAPPRRQPRHIGSAGPAGEIAANLHPSQRASRVPPPQAGLVDLTRRPDFTHSRGFR
jgi:hypothetical protein